MPELAPAVYLPVAGALCAAIVALWGAWRSERAFRAADNRAHTERFEGLARDVLGLPEHEEPRR